MGIQDRIVKLPCDGRIPTSASFAEMSPAWPGPRWHSSADADADADEFIFAARVCATWSSILHAM